MVRQLPATKKKRGFTEQLFLPAELKLNQSLQAILTATLHKLRPVLCGSLPLFYNSFMSIGR